ncbi:MAG TPA: anhydro-N-acetylmuramic acid kinase [Bryobacteraceae bacterium]|jgi:anhydro-N-acetylmuramic acid kinase|nr:anhydro-N-acetylmuramic acid kinase [Bryobacteraceae bacterium]
MRVAGVMSGTSLDGIDVAIVDIARRHGGVRVKPVAFHTTPYPKLVREAILGVSNAMTHTATIARLNFLLGELYASAIRETCRRGRVSLDSIVLAGVHGQTIFHEAAPIEYLGHCIASTLQIGEAAVVAERTGLWTISNFRERDIAAGGQGAPLVPSVDFLLFRSRRSARVALNIGGIANISFIPAGAGRDDVIAFDTGPGNMIIDALVSHYTNGAQNYDRGGRIARQASIHPRMLEAMLSDPYFKLDPPKACGREQFGREFVSGLVATGLPLPDLIATATELTARTVAAAIARFEAREVIASGGGVHNRRLMRRLRELLPEHSIVTSAEYGIDPDAKEAIAFAILAYEFVQRRPGNLPSATGARHSVLLGKDSPAC